MRQNYTTDTVRNCVRDAYVIGVTDACKKYGVPYNTAYNWYSGRTTREVTRDVFVELGVTPTYIFENRDGECADDYKYMVNKQKKTQNKKTVKAEKNGTYHMLYEDTSTPDNGDVANSIAEAEYATASESDDAFTRMSNVWGASFHVNAFSGDEESDPDDDDSYDDEDEMCDTDESDVVAETEHTTSLIKESTESESTIGETELTIADLQNTIRTDNALIGELMMEIELYKSENDALHSLVRAMNDRAYRRKTVRAY